MLRKMGNANQNNNPQFAILRKVGEQQKVMVGRVAKTITPSVTTSFIMQN